MKFISAEKDQKLNKKNIKDGDFSYVFFFGVTMIIFTIFGLLATGWFVYTNIYQTIGKIQTISAFESGFNFRPINFKLFNETTLAWEKKQNQEVIPEVRDPFNPLPQEIIIEGEAEDSNETQ